MHAVRFHAVLDEERTLPLPKDVQLAPGPVEVIVLQATDTPEPPGLPTGQSLQERLLQKVRQLDLHGLPEDLAEHHDHYVHGTPKDTDAS